MLFTTIKIFNVANYGAKLQLTTSLDNEQYIYVVRTYCAWEKIDSYYGYLCTNAHR